MHLAALLLAFVTVTAGALTMVSWRAGLSPNETEPARRLADVLLPTDADLIAAVVPARSTLAGLLHAHEVLADDISALVAEASRHFDLRRVRAGQPFTLERLLDGRVRAFTYEIDRDRQLALQRADEGFEAAIVEIPKIVEVTSVAGEISRETPSLVQAIDAAGEHIELSLALADIFSGDVDFTSDVHPGDTFRLVVERATREDGTFAGYGPVLAAEFVNKGRELRAVRFTPPGGQPGYYDEQGRSLRRFFLKSPLKFEPRITSAFSRARRHPILNYTRAHNGVDYAAPTGAPVVSVASGVVTFAGWAGGGGRTVRIRHSRGYESEYLHLSAIAVRRGARVAQGELIGRVGMTGLATGPHLHYGLRRNGTYVNPVREHREMPPGDPIAPVYRAAFAQERDRLFDLIADPATASRNADN